MPCPNYQLKIEMAGGYYLCGTGPHAPRCFGCEKDKNLFPCSMKIWVPRHDYLRHRCSLESMGWYCPHNGYEMNCRHRNPELHLMNYKAPQKLYLEATN